MKTVAEWIRDRDWLGGEYDTTDRMAGLLTEVYDDFISLLNDLGRSPCARVDARQWAQWLSRERPAAEGRPQGSPHVVRPRPGRPSPEGRV